MVDKTPEVPANLKVGDRIPGTDYFVSENRYPVIKLTLEIVCERLKTWCNIDCCKDQQKLLAHWNSQDGVPNRDRTILLADNSVSSRYKVYSKRRQTVEQKIINKKNGYLKNSKTVEGKDSTHYVESSAIGAFFESKNKSKKLEELFNQLEFLPAFDGLYADLIVRIKGTDKWKMLQIKSSIWTIGKYSPYLCVNKRKYKDNIYIICIGIDEIEQVVPDNPNMLFKCSLKEILFMGDGSNIDKLNIRPYYKTPYDHLRVCFYEQDKSLEEKYKIEKYNPIERYEKFMETFIRVIKDEKHQYTYDKIMYDLSINLMPDSCKIEKEGFKLLDNILKDSQYILRAPYRQNETVDFIIYKNDKEYLCISAKTCSIKTYKEKLYSKHFSKGTSLNKHLCDYVFVFVRIDKNIKNLIILSGTEVYIKHTHDSFSFYPLKILDLNEQIITEIDNLFLI